MYLFKTSGSTFDSVIENQKHAFSGMPRDWFPGELVLVSKNKSDCNYREKQIQYTMRLDDIRPIKSGEADKYWPGNEGRWKYLVICNDTKRIKQPFNLEEILGYEAKRYGPVITFSKFTPEHEKIIEEYLKKVGSIQNMESLKEELNRFVTERDWGKYHSPKNLAMGLSV